jgi:hypothetical protein
MTQLGVVVRVLEYLADEPPVVASGGSLKRLQLWEELVVDERQEYLPRDALRIRRP